MLCKKCKIEKDFLAFSAIKRKNSTTYRQSCKACEYQAAKDRANAKIARIDTQNEINEKISKGTDPAFFVDDPEARMPSDGDLMFWSTPFFELITEGRKVLMNKVPKDEK